MTSAGGCIILSKRSKDLIRRSLAYATNWTAVATVRPGSARYAARHRLLATCQSLKNNRLNKRSQMRQTDLSICLYATDGVRRIPKEDTHALSSH